MKNNKNIWRKTVVAAGVAAMLFSSCNKDLDNPGDISVPPYPTGTKLGASLGAGDSLFKRLLTRTGLISMLNDSTHTYTVFVPVNAAMRGLVSAYSGGKIPPYGLPNDSLYSDFLNKKLPLSVAQGIASYHILPTATTYAALPTTWPNVPLPTLINPAPSLSALARLDGYPSVINGNWYNNVPVVQADMAASNGVIHHIAGVALPPDPSKPYLWSRISTDPNLTYLAAAVHRADSLAIGSTTPTDSLQNVLNMFGPDLTVFAPTDSAFKTTLMGAVYPGVYAQMYQGAYAQATGAGLPDTTAKQMATAYATANAPAAAMALVSTTDVFKNPLLFGALSAKTVKGILAYHVLGQRTYLNNFPTTLTNHPTLLNLVFPTHPGVGLVATLSPAMGVVSAEVKGLANATPSNVFVNPYATSDQGYVNGVLHEIDQVLLPQ